MSLLETNSFDNLIAGDFPVVTGRGTLVSGQVLSRGALLGKITATGATKGKLKQCDSASSDGSQNPYAILMEDADASTNAYVDIYLSGEFNEDMIGLATGDLISDFADALRDLSIFVKTTQGA